jgi:hypothetical protein
VREIQITGITSKAPPLHNPQEWGTLKFETTQSPGHPPHDYLGRDAIRQWKQAADEKYRYTMQPLTAQTHGNDVTVRARLTGEFPGSPVELNHFFKLSKAKIASLEIRS